MKKLMGYTALALIGLNLGLSAQAVRVSAQDIVCHFRYKIGDNSWILDSTGGTTRLQARRFSRQVIQRKQRLAEEAGVEFQVIFTGCKDPYGHN